MDAISDPTVLELWVMKSAQTGWTEILCNAVAYFASQDPSPVLMLQPTIWFEVTARTIRNWLNDPVDPMPAVWREAQKLPPLIDVAAATRWLVLRRKRNPDFGRHGGYR